MRTKQGADGLAKRLNQCGISSAAIHGDRNQLQRTQALADFKQNLVPVLVATDVAARGLDIEELTHVVNFELPNNPEDYVHRIGRTGRAGTKGFAISLVSQEESKLLIDIERILKIEVKVEKIEGFELRNLQPKTLDHDTSTSEKELNSNFLSKQTKKASSLKNNETIGRTKKNVVSNSRNTMHSKNNEDPLFTQPYVSKYSDAKGVIVESNRLNKKEVLKKYSNRSLPALFISPVISKQK